MKPAPQLINSDSRMPEPHPGDHLLYGVSRANLRDWFFGEVTCIKTWSPAVHIEIYDGNQRSFASRNGIGVNVYPFRRENLIAILRPNQPINLKDARDWFYREAIGQGYDWKGLLCFMLAARQGSPNKMFCSEFATRYGRKGGFNAMHPAWDADKVAPGNFLMSPAFHWIYAHARLLAQRRRHSFREPRLFGPLSDPCGRPI